MTAAAWEDAHQTSVMQSAERVSAGRSRRVYRLVCGCGFEGPARTRMTNLRGDVTAHLVAVSPVPQDERCTQPTAHRRRPWERCALCADQLVMPGMEEL